MKNLLSIIANLILLAFISARTKNIVHNSKKSVPNLDLKKNKEELIKSKFTIENTNHLIDK